MAQDKDGLGTLMPAERGLVSVVVPVLNAERYLAEALDSVLAQTYARWELVVVDGGSSDGTQAVALSYGGVRWLRQTGRGFADAWNCGLAQARGEWVAFLDSDDVWVADKLAWQTAHLDAHPEHDYVIGHARFFLDEDQPVPARFDAGLLNRDHVSYHPSFLLARRALFERVGGFRTDFKIASDIEWFARLHAEGVRFGLLPQVLGGKRVHPGSLSYEAQGPELIRREVLRLLKDSLDRRRRREREQGEADQAEHG